MIISNKEELLQEIDNLLGLKAHKTIERIIFLCPNMNASLITHDNQSPQNLGQEILKKLQQTRNNTTIHSFEALSQEQILGTKQPYSLPKHITIDQFLVIILLCLKLSCSYPFCLKIYSTINLFIYHPPSYFG